MNYLRAGERRRRPEPLDGKFAPRREQKRRVLHACIHGRGFIQVVCARKMQGAATAWLHSIAGTRSGFRVGWFLISLYGTCMPSSVCTTRSSRDAEERSTRAFVCIRIITQYDSHGQCSMPSGHGLKFPFSTARVPPSSTRHLHACSRQTCTGTSLTWPGR